MAGTWLRSSLTLLCFATFMTTHGWKLLNGQRCVNVLVIFYTRQVPRLIYDNFSIDGLLKDYLNAFIHMNFFLVTFLT